MCQLNIHNWHGSPTGISYCAMDWVDCTQQCFLVLGFSCYTDCTSFPSACICTALLLEELGMVPKPEAKCQDLAHIHTAWSYIHLQHRGLVCTVQPHVCFQLSGSPVVLTQVLYVSKFLMVKAVLLFTKAAASVSWTWAYVSRTPLCSPENIWGYLSVQSLMNHGKMLVGRAATDQLAQSSAQSMPSSKLDQHWRSCSAKLRVSPHEISETFVGNTSCA